jgi:hypothetical protein
MYANTNANIKPGSGHDLFFKLGSDNFRLWKIEIDDPPRYKPDIENERTSGDLKDEDSDDPEVRSQIPNLPLKKICKIILSRTSPFQVRSATVQHRRHGGVNGRRKGRGQGL